MSLTVEQLCVDCLVTAVAQEALVKMTKLQVYDPAMCCSTGVRGPQVDPVLPRFSEDVHCLANQGVAVER
jgi:Arsenical resistance operon protein ArsD